MWAQSAVFGEPPPELRGSAAFTGLAMLRAHDGPTLPETLSALGAEGWLAEGLTRLFLVEHLTTRHVGNFERLEIGPTTDIGVRVKAAFAIRGETRLAVLDGFVPLRRAIQSPVAF
jgi:hypothetical protein